MICILGWTVTQGGRARGDLRRSQIGTDPNSDEENWGGTLDGTSLGIGMGATDNMILGASDGTTLAPRCDDITWVGALDGVKLGVGLGVTVGTARGALEGTTLGIRLGAQDGMSLGVGLGGMDCTSDGTG
jgi:hypothetical protein